MSKLEARQRQFAKTRTDDGQLEPLTVRIPVAVRLTGKGRSKLYELIKAGDLDTVKVGAATLVSMTSLRRLTERGSA